MKGTMTCSTKMINNITVRFIRPENAGVTANPNDDAVKISNVGHDRYRIAHKTADGHHANSIVSGNSVFRWFRRAISNMIVDEDAYSSIQIDWILFPSVYVSRDNLKQNDVYSSILDSVEFHLDNWPGSEDDRSECCDGDNVIAEFYFNYPFDYSEEVPEIDEDTASESSDSSDDSDATEEVSPVRRSSRIAKKAPVAYSDDSDDDSEDDSEYTASEDESEEEEDVAPTPTRRSKRLAQKPQIVYSELSDDEDAHKIRVHTFYDKNGKETSRRVYNLRTRA